MSDSNTRTSTENRNERFIELFSQLSDEGQSLVCAELRDRLSKEKAEGKDGAA